ncbi:MAG: glycosyltransferase, partial [Nanoarchaeota archaeon]
AAIAKKQRATVYVHPKNYGLAETFRTELKEFLKSDADIFVHIDADNQYDPKDIPRLIDEIEKGADLVLGNRFLGGIESMPLLKRLGNKAFSHTISKIIKYKIGDCQTGFRAFTREVAKIPITSTHTYTQEQVIRAVKEKLKVKEIPVYFRTRKDKSRLISNPLEYAIKAWINILRVYRDFEPLKFFGRIGVCFLGAGIITGLWLVYLFITTGRVGHIPLTILTILLIMIGIQIIMFGFLADMRKK